MIKENQMGKPENEFLQRCADGSVIYISEKRKELVGILDEVISEIDTAICELQCKREPKATQRLLALENRIERLLMRLTREDAEDNESEKPF